MVWVNEDRPTRKDVIHIEGCKYEVGKRETPNKGINERRKDGGWYSFASEVEALQKFPGAVRCGECMRGWGCAVGAC